MLSVVASGYLSVPACVVCKITQNRGRIPMKFSEWIASGTEKTRLTFGTDPAHNPDHSLILITGTE